MAAYPPHPFVCRHCGWHLGEMFRERNQRVTRLRVYRHSRGPGSPTLDDPDMPAWFKFAGTINDGAVICEHCGNENDWYIAKQGLEELLEKARRRMVLPALVEVA